MTRPPHDAYNSLYVSGGYNTFTRDMTDSLASIWSRNSPSGENVAFSGGYGQFPDSSQGQFGATSASGQFASNLGGHFPPASDYSAYAQQYGYGSQYTQWDDGVGRGSYSYLGSGVQKNASGAGLVSDSDRVSDAHHGVDKVRLTGKTAGGKGQLEFNNQPKSKKMSWANVASQPAKPPITILKSKRPGVLPPPSVIPSKPPVQLASIPPEKMAIPPLMEIPLPFSARELPKREEPVQPPNFNNNNTSQASDQKHGANSAHQEYQSTRPLPRTYAPAVDEPSRNESSLQTNHSVLDNLRSSYDYNPKSFDIDPKNAKFFVIKSFSEDDIHRSIKYQIWCSTDFGNKRLDDAFRKLNGMGPIYLLFSVNGSGHFCGMAEMLSPVDYSNSSSVWVQDKFKGQFKVKWIYVKDVPNHQLRHIKLENNENKPVTNSRDTQEVPPDKGTQVLKIIHGYNHSTSIFDDFVHYEKRQQEEQNCKKANGNPGYQSSKNDYRSGRRDEQHFHQGGNDHQRGGSRPYRGGHYNSRSGPPPPRN